MSAGGWRRGAQDPASRVWRGRGLWTPAWGAGVCNHECGRAPTRGRGEPRALWLWVPWSAPYLLWKGTRLRKEVRFNLGEQRELLTCHWHPLFLKKLRETRDSQERRARLAAVAPRLCGLQFSNPGPRLGRVRPRPAPPRPCARPRPSRLRGVGPRANGKLATSAGIANHRRKC